MRKPTTTTANNSTANFEKKVHFINFYERETGIELGYRTIDDLPEQYLLIAQKSEEACDKLFGNNYQRAVYRQAGISKKKSALSMDDF